MHHFLKILRRTRRALRVLTPGDHLLLRDIYMRKGSNNPEVPATVIPSARALLMKQADLETWECPKYV